MNQTEIGKFIAKCRKEKQLTQAQLAEKLNLTDRAVSKWETGKSMPDSSVMLELCEILGITVNELLSGEEIGMERYEEKADENLIALKKREENNLTRNLIISILYSVTLWIGILVCLICNMAISGRFTWAQIPVSSIVFVWLVSFPCVTLGKRGVGISLVSYSIFIIPYLYLLSRFVAAKEVFSVGALIAAASIVFLWIIAELFRRIGKTRRLAALGSLFLCAVPFVCIVNFVLFKMLPGTMFNIWNLSSIFLLLALAFTFFLCDYVQKRG